MLAPTDELNNLQKELLKLYANNISEESLSEIKSLLSQFFAQKATEEMDVFMVEKGLTGKNMVDWANKHNRIESSH